MSDPFEMAVEHAAYCISQGMTVLDVLSAINAPPPNSKPTWNDAIWALARIASDGQWHIADKPVTIHRPLRLVA